MRSVQMTAGVPLASIKPLDRMDAYRRYCLDATRQALQAAAPRVRASSLVDGAAVKPAGEVEGFVYVRDASGSLFLKELPASAPWAGLLKQVNEYRHAPDTFHQQLSSLRRESVYRPKLAWIQETLRLQGLARPRLLEVTTPPSDLTSVLEQSRSFRDVVTVDEMALIHEPAATHAGERVQAAVLLESLDRVDDPVALLKVVRDRLDPGGLLFVTALASSGFDMSVLGLRSLYIYPPDRANCFSRAGLQALLQRAGFTLMEVSTPGALDVEIVQEHLRRDPTIMLSTFERQILNAGDETRAAFQAFLQQQGLSSFIRMVARPSEQTLGLRRDG